MIYRLLAPFTGLALAAGILLSAGGSSVVSAAATGGVSVQMTTLHPVSAITLNIHNLPVEHAAALRAGVGRAMPLLYPHANPGTTGTVQLVSPVQGPFKNGGGTGFDGMADSASICPYFGGCQPPDMALASSNSYIFQGVNTSWETYTPSGSVVSGPITSQAFFGVPNPAPAGCDPNGPFLSDPRAFYDPNDGLFWAATLQIENAFGIAPSCNFLSQMWVANYNPSTGVIHSYAFDTTLGQDFANDYTQFGFNGTTVAVGANMFTQDGSAYAYAETLFMNKQAMEQGNPVTPVAASNYIAGGVVLDDVQPVETPTLPSKDPGVLYLANSFNSPDPSGSDCVSTPCHGFVVWAYDPTTSTVSGTIVNDNNLPYTEPIPADEPGCKFCIETLDNRISGTPVYNVDGNTGLISWAHETNVNNGTRPVPAVQWGQFQPTLSGHTVTGATVYQAGNVSFPGDQAASFGAVMADTHSNLTMVFDTMSGNLNPSIMVASRTKHDPLGTLETPVMVKQGVQPTLDSRWGDYEAASYTGHSSNNIWVASEYSGSDQDWHTFIYQAQ